MLRLRFFFHSKHFSLAWPTANTSELFTEIELTPWPRNKCRCCAREIFLPIRQWFEPLNRTESDRIPCSYGKKRNERKRKKIYIMTGRKMLLHGLGNRLMNFSFLRKIMIPTFSNIREFHLADRSVLGNESGRHSRRTGHSLFAWMNFSS